MAKDKAKKNFEKTLLDPVNRGMLNDAVDTILKGMDNMFSRFQEELDGVKNEVLKNRTEIKGLRNDFHGLLEEYSDTPTRKEFNELKEKVARFHPSS